MHYVFATGNYIYELIASSIVVSIMLWLHEHYDRTLTKRGKYVFCVVIVILLLVVYCFIRAK
jgi:hypothetical protein